MKKRLLSVLTVIGIIVSGCSDQPYISADDAASSIESEECSSYTEVETTPSKTEKIYGEALVNYMTDEEIIQNSDVGVAAVYKGKEEHTYNVDYIFEVSENVWGSTEKIIRVRENYSFTVVVQKEKKVTEFGFVEDRFVEGELYFIAAEKKKSIIFPYGVIYLMPAELTISLDRKEFWSYGQKRDYPEEEITTTHFLDIYNQKLHENSQAYEPKEYADAFEEMWDKSEYVVRLKITGLHYEGETGVLATNIYYAEVVDQYSGQYPIYTDDKNTILISILKDTVVTGEEYVIGCSCVDRGVLTENTYWQETPDSVYIPDDVIMDRINSKKHHNNEIK